MSARHEETIDALRGAMRSSTAAGNSHDSCARHWSSKRIRIVLVWSRPGAPPDPPHRANRRRGIRNAKIGYDITSQPAFYLAVLRGGDHGCGCRRDCQSRAVFCLARVLATRKHRVSICRRVSLGQCNYRGALWRLLGRSLCRPVDDPPQKCAQWCPVIHRPRMKQ